jgi:hypothetical protein
MFVCSGLEGVPLPAITRFKHISKLSIFAEEGGVNGNGTATNKKLTPLALASKKPELKTAQQEVPQFVCNNGRAMKSTTLRWSLMQHSWESETPKGRYDVENLSANGKKMTAHGQSKVAKLPLCTP